MRTPDDIAIRDVARTSAPAAVPREPAARKVPLLEGLGIHKSYIMGRTPVHVLRGADLRVDAGEFVAVMGASGSGKSTLLHILGAIDTPDSGGVRFQGQNVGVQSGRWRDRYRNRDVGFVFQFYHLLPELNVLENVLISRMVGVSILAWRREKKSARVEAEALIEKMGLTARRTHRPNELSGGERQRVAIARALVYRPKLLLADEPTGNLDAATGKDILAVLTKLHQDGQTIVMVTHDAEIAARAGRKLLLANGKVQAYR